MFPSSSSIRGSSPASQSRESAAAPNQEEVERQEASLWTHQSLFFENPQDLVKTSKLDCHMQKSSGI